MALEFIEFLSRIKDRRRAQGKKWKLEKLLFATILAFLSGATSYRKVHRYINLKNGCAGRPARSKW